MVVMGVSKNQVEAAYRRGFFGVFGAGGRFPRGAPLGLHPIDLMVPSDHSLSVLVRSTRYSTVVGAQPSLDHGEEAAFVAASSSRLPLEAPERSFPAAVSVVIAFSNVSGSGPLYHDLPRRRSTGHTRSHRHRPTGRADRLLSLGIS